MARPLFTPGTCCGPARVESDESCFGPQFVIGEQLPKIVTNRAFAYPEIDTKITMVTVKLAVLLYKFHCVSCDKKCKNVYLRSTAF